MTLRKQENTVNWKRRNYIALCEELALEDAMDLSSERPGSEWKFVYSAVRAKFFYVEKYCEGANCSHWTSDKSCCE
jgi:hypothetical protein